ncbi:hypothetical protein C8R44DRAFT_731783 [Mycena epipterygia]|nr:hypothetical protein C8R44DRAFT_731783 [Mycena epipterygia]
MSAPDDAAAACCGLCCFCGFGALESWCDLNAYGGRGGRHITGCCGSCCNRSFNEDSMDRWDKDKAQLREKPADSQPEPSPPMSIPAPPSSTEPSPASANPTSPPAAHVK